MTSKGVVVVFLLPGDREDPRLTQTDKAMQGVARKFEKDNIKFAWLNTLREEHSRATGLLTVCDVHELGSSDQLHVLALQPKSLKYTHERFEEEAQAAAFVERLLSGGVTFNKASAKPEF
jgi:transposase-like protein